MIITKSELDALALKLVNAMILEGPENEQELHLLQILLDPEEDDELETAVVDASEYIQQAYTVMSDMIDELEQLLE